MEPAMQIIHQRTRSCLTDLTTQASRLATNLTFYVVELSDTLDGLAGSGSAVGHMDVVQITPRMSPACAFPDPAAFVEMMEPSVGIGLQDTGKMAQMLLRMFSLAIFRVGEPHGRRHITARRSIVAHIGPQPAGLGLTCAGSQHRNGRVIRV